MAALTLLRCHLIWATSVSHRQVLSPVWSCFLKQAGLDHSLGSGYCTYWGGLTRLATQAIFSLPSPRCFGSKSACLPQKWSIGFLQPQGGSSSLCKTSWPGLPVSGPNCSSPHCPHNLPFHELAQMAKRLPAMRETWVLSLGWEDPLEKEMTTHSNTVAWKIPWIEDPGRLQSMWLQRVRHDWATSLSSFFFHESPPRSTSPDMITLSLLFPSHLTPCGSFLQPSIVLQSDSFQWKLFYM